MLCWPKLKSAIYCGLQAISTARCGTAMLSALQKHLSAVDDRSACNSFRL